MGFLGLGTGEIIVIAVVALIIFGPGKLPEVAGQVGKLLRDFRKMTGNLTSEFEQTAGLDDIKRTVQREIAGVQKEVDAVTKGVKKDLAGSKPAAKPAAKSGSMATAKTGTATAKTATTTAKPAATSLKTGLSTIAKKSDEAAEEVVVPKAPSKADPFADLIAIDAGGAAMPKTPIKVIASKNVPAAPAVDHLAQVRARRMNPAADRSSTSA